MKKNNLKQLIKQLEKEGVLAWTENVFKNKESQVYLVGGAVRDALLGIKEIKDFDFVVRGLDIEELKSILEKLGKVDLVGKNFGVLKFLPRGIDLKVPLDIALPRVEVALATGGYRDFNVNYDKTLDIKEDLGRRDFTINALAWDIKKKLIVDEFRGLKDLQNKMIQTVGNAKMRFREDYSRMLRAIRFSCQLNFDIEEKTWRAIKEQIKNINEKRDKERVVPYEVIASEFLKAFIFKPVRAFDLYDKAGAFQELIPEILKMKNCPQPTNWHSEGDVWEHTRLCMRNLTAKTFLKRFNKDIIFGRKKNNKNKIIGAELVMAILFHDIGKPDTIQTPAKDKIDRIRFNSHDALGSKIAKDIFERLKLSAAPEFEFDPDKVAWLIGKHHLFDTKTIKEMKNATVEKYFFGERFWGEDLLKLAFIDMMSSLRPSGEPDLGNFNLMVKRINKLKLLGKGKKLPEPFLNGDEIMKILNIQAGKKVGELLRDLREKQLSGEVRTKKEAVSFIKTLKP